MSLLNNELDFNILKFLQKDGRISFTDLASKLNVSISTIRNRYNNLVKGDVVQVYGRINPEKIGLKAHTCTFISVSPKNKMESVVEELLKIPEISYLASISGKYDLELNIMCKDNDHFIDVLYSKIDTIDGVSSSKTNFYFKVFKFAPPNLDKLRNIEVLLSKN